MEQKVTISGMTCGGCAATVKDALLQLPEVKDVIVHQDHKEVVLKVTKRLDLALINTVLPEKYIADHAKETLQGSEATTSEPSKWEQLQPLFLIFFYLVVASILLNVQSWDTKGFMLDFMGLFFVVFSFFKFLDYRGFPVSFAMYDPLAKRLPFYGWVYPFIEVGLGLLFLFRYQIEIALVVTLVILGITTIGVTQSLLNKSNIQCACLGTALNLPMTEATFIENAIMLAMVLGMWFL